jgi:hypothetical protein
MGRKMALGGCIESFCFWDWSSSLTLIPEYELLFVIRSLL